MFTMANPSKMEHLSRLNGFGSIFRSSGSYQRQVTHWVCYFAFRSKILQNISRELGIWSSLDHPNVLLLLGYTMNGGATFAFICQWMENGTTREYLKEHPETDTFQMVRELQFHPLALQR